ncbi:MAG: ribosomal-processing cysteine protease Prp [Candidatus Bipolaricaulia bacterium]
MVEIKISRDEKRKIREFESSGHANYAEVGQDIVCAGVSSLLQTAVLGLEVYLRTEPKVKQKEGWLRCRVDRDEIYMDREIDAILETMLLGLKAIQEQHPDHLKLEEVTSDVAGKV